MEYHKAEDFPNGYWQKEAVKNGMKIPKLANPDLKDLERRIEESRTRQRNESEERALAAQKGGVVLHFTARHGVIDQSEVA